MRSGIRSRRSTASDRKPVANPKKISRRLSNRYELLDKVVIFASLFILGFISVNFLTTGVAVPRSLAFRKKQTPRACPRMVQIVNSEQSAAKVSYVESGPPKRVVKRMGSKSRQKAVAWNSESYADLHEYLDEGQEDCQLEYDWQRRYRPQCNSIHETDLASLFDKAGNVRVQYLANGAYRDVWTVMNEVGEKFVFKPMRWKREFTFRNMDRMRRDALVMDRLAGHKYILDIYSACGTSGAFELATGGTISDAIWPDSKGLS